MNKQEELKGWHSFNLGTGNGTTVLELVAAFEEVSGLTIKKIMGPRRPGDVDQLLAIADKANTVLEWKTELSIIDMCRDSWNFV